MEKQVSVSLDELSSEILNCAFKVHTYLGPGLFENVYEAALEYELKKKGFVVQRQVTLPVIYEKIELQEGFRIDLLVENQIIIELKSVKELDVIHQTQLITYLKLANKPRGLLLNFNTNSLRDGIKKCYNKPSYF